MIIDIHSHILPNVDDGSENMSMSIEMARLYLQNGIHRVIGTPHYIEGSMDNSLDNNRIALETLRKELFREGIDLEVFLGNEIYVSMNTSTNIIENRVSTLNGSRYILLELPMYDIPLYMENLLYELQLKGIIPIIAHPERNTKIIEDPNILYNYIQKGALGQLNLPSLEGRYGTKVKSTAEILLKHQMIHFVGTDAHTDRRRSPNVQKGLKVLGSLVREEDFENICYKNAELLLEDKLIMKKPPIKYEVKRGLLGLFRRSKKVEEY